MEPAEAGGERREAQMAKEAVDQDWAWDDVRGGYLGEANVAEARCEEVGYMLGKGIWQEVHEDEC